MLKCLNHPQHLPLLMIGVLLGFGLQHLTRPKPGLAQIASPADVAQWVYQRVPDLPLENQYVRAASNRQAVDSTLVSRLVLYHTKVKGRPPLQRLDWKITLADYLGVNEFLQAETYPGHAFLKTNPMERDRTLIQGLRQVQRNALVQSLVDAFNQPADRSANPPSAAAGAPKPDPAPAVLPVLPPLANPGSANFLKPEPSGRPSQDTGEAQFLRP